jgi:hypothetical protein
MLLVERSVGKQPGGAGQEIGAGINLLVRGDIAYHRPVEKRVAIKRRGLFEPMKCHTLFLSARLDGAKQIVDRLMRVGGNADAAARLDQRKDDM